MTNALLHLEVEYCITRQDITNGGSTLYGAAFAYGMGEDASKLHIVIVKSNPMPLTVDNIEWQMVAAIPDDQPSFIKRNKVIGSKRMVCAVDSTGSFTLLTLDGSVISSPSLRYDPPLVVNTTFSTPAKWSTIDVRISLVWDENIFALFNIPQPASKRFQLCLGHIPQENGSIAFALLNSTLQQLDIVPQFWNLTSVINDPIPVHAPDGEIVPVRGFQRIVAASKDYLVIPEIAWPDIPSTNQTHNISLIYLDESNRGSYKRGTYAVNITAPFGIPSGSEQPPSPPSESSKKYWIIGVVLGVLVALALVGYFVMRRRRAMNAKRSVIPDKTQQGESSIDEIEMWMMQKQPEKDDNGDKQLEDELVGKLAIIDNTDDVYDDHHHAGIHHKHIKSIESNHPIKSNQCVNWIQLYTTCTTSPATDISLSSPKTKHCHYS
ncbi:hypothetical protein BGW42_006941 [Actinomortierella wolfii]|nr:hypothetical protein BGW42_006941 [Actinomortierella wolfii]